MSKKHDYSRVAKGRGLSGLSVDQAAKLLGLTRARLASIESGNSKPSPTLLKDMANVYGVSLPWITGNPPKLANRTKKLLRDSELMGTERDKIEKILESISAIEEK